jgi:hypothetical protein
MGLPSKKQEEYYEKYWNKIEVCTKYDVSSFIRDYLSVKQQEIPKLKRIYIDFKDYVELGKIETGPLLEEMLAYAKRYQILLDGNSGSSTLDACIDRLNRLETTVTRPYFLEVLRLKDEDKLPLEQVTEIFLLAENYLFRRTICGLATNALNKIFLMLHREIVRFDGTEDNYVEKFKYALRAKKGTSRFPDDKEFRSAFTESSVYTMNSNKIYILERFENFGTKEDKDVYRHCDDKIYSIEHIMPQHLTQEWQRELGDDYEQIHEQWLHRIANLTLTAYNSKYSNNSFTEKKTMKDGFNDSGIRMNTWIAQKDKWTLTELKERNDYLMDRALTIWEAPVTEYKPASKQLDRYTLEDDSTLLIGSKVAKFAFKNTEQTVKDWAEMLQKVIQILYSEDKTIITKLASSEEERYFFFNDGPKPRGNSAEIGDGIHVYTNTDTPKKMTLLERLFKQYDEDPSDLVFYLRDKKPSAQ